MRTTVEELRRRGAEAMLSTADIRDEEAVARAFAEVERSWGGVDVLVPLAGVKAILSTHRANRRGESRSVIVTVSSDRLTVAALPGDGAPAVSVGVDTLGLEPVALESVLRQDATPRDPRLPHAVLRGERSPGMR